MSAPLIKNSYSQAQVVPKEDPRLYVEDVEYPGERGVVLAHFARPNVDVKLPGVIVISEVWGLTDHIKDVARRVALEGFLAIAPDALSPFGGTPDNADEARSLTQKLDHQATVKNFVDSAVRPWAGCWRVVTHRLQFVQFGKILSRKGLSDKRCRQSSGRNFWIPNWKSIRRIAKSTQTTLVSVCEQGL